MDWLKLAEALGIDIEGLSEEQIIEACEAAMKDIVDPNEEDGGEGEGSGDGGESGEGGEKKLAAKPRTLDENLIEVRKLLEMAQRVSKNRSRTDQKELKAKALPAAKRAMGRYHRKMRFSDVQHQRKGSESIVGKSYARVMLEHPSSDYHMEVQRANNDVVLTHNWMMASNKEYRENPDIRSLETFKSFSSLTRELRAALKDTSNPLNTATATEGTEWVPTLLASELLDTLYRQELQIPALFREVDMPSKVYEFPVQTGKAQAIYEAETTDVPADLYTADGVAPSTTKLTLTAKKLAVKVPISGEAEEDMIIPAIPFLRGEIATALAEGEENAIINGDTTATHMDYDVEQLGATDIRAMWLGLRAFAVDASATINGGGGALALAHIEAALKAGGKHFRKNRETAILMSDSNWWDLSTETDSPIKDASKLGQSTPLATGQLGAVYGKPIFASDYVRTVLTANGYNENGGSNDLSSCLVFNHRRWMRGMRRGATVEGFRDPLHDFSWLIIRKRGAFQELESAGSTIEWCQLIRNITA